MNKVLFGIVTISVVALLSVGIVSAFGFGNGFMNQDMTEEEKTEMEQFREQVRQSVEAGDFESWKNLMQSRLTEENFQRIQERHAERNAFREANAETMEAIKEAMKSGDIETAKNLKQQIGMEKGNGRSGYQKMNCLSNE
ncbi:MAG: hypothetical protein PHU63_04255 [Candidatus ainarchaeum sp.]|nr:hypothetical protein [Candidatus ainarchaeum sp.]